MAPKVKSVVSAISDAVETACGWAILAVAVYAALFVDVTGGGTLWSSIRGLAGHASAPAEAAPDAIRRAVVPAHGVERGDPNTDRSLIVFDEPRQDGVIVAAVAAPDASRPAYTDSPADPAAGKDWKKSLKGDLRKFATYGRGDQAPVSATFSAPAAGQEQAAPAIAAAAGSAASAGARAAARPGVGTRLGSGSSAHSDSVRNIR